MIVVMISGPHQVAGGGDGGVCGVLLAAGAGGQPAKAPQGHITTPAQDRMGDPVGGQPCRIHNGAVR